MTDTSDEKNGAPVSPLDGKGKELTPAFESSAEKKESVYASSTPLSEENMGRNWRFPHTVRAFGDHNDI